MLPYDKFYRKLKKRLTGQNRLAILEPLTTQHEGEKMNRKLAESNYFSSVADRRALESSYFGMSEEEHKQAYFQACRAESDACVALVAAEIAFPTEAEQRRAYKKLAMRNRGYDC